MRHLECDRYSSGIGVGHPHFGNIGAAEHANGRFLIDAGPAACALAVEKSLDGGEECDEFAVVPFLKQGRIAGELVLHLSPEVVVARCLNKVAMLLDRYIIADRHELQRPEHNLSKMPDDLARIGRNWITHMHCARL